LLKRPLKRQIAWRRPCEEGAASMGGASKRRKP
jgi:hypothetical protein